MSLGNMRPCLKKKSPRSLEDSHQQTACCVSTRTRVWIPSTQIKCQEELWVSVSLRTGSRDSGFLELAGYPACLSLVRDSVPKSNVESGLRKAPNISLWPLHTHYTCAQTPVRTCANTHSNTLAHMQDHTPQAYIHTKRKKKKKKNQEHINQCSSKAQLVSSS